MSGIVNSAGSKSGVIGQTELDYEEGTFTLAYSDGSSNFTMNSGQSTGFYTKIGRVVTISGRYEATSLNSVTTSQVRMVGLPFTADSTSYTGMTAITMSHASGFAVDVGDSIDGFVEAGQTYIRLRIWDQTGGQRDVNQGHISADGAMVIGGTYTT